MKGHSMTRLGKPLASIQSVVILSVLACSQPVFAADLGQSEAASPPAPAGSGWEKSLTSYGWLTFLSGSTTVKGRTVDVDVDPIQVIDHLDRMPFMGYGEIRKGPLALYTDIVYADLGLSESGIHARPNGTIGTALGLNFTQLIAEAGLLYEVARWDETPGSIKDPAASSSYTALDLYAGARYWYQELDVNFSLTGTADTGGLVVSGARAIARSGSVDWADPLIGLRLRHQYAPGTELFVKGDIGGFGAGSQFSWNVLGAVNYEIMRTSSYNASAYLGYRALSVDYVQGEGWNRYEFNVIQHGPVIGVTVKY